MLFGIAILPKLAIKIFVKTNYNFATEISFSRGKFEKRPDKHTVVVNKMAVMGQTSVHAH